MMVAKQLPSRFRQACIGTLSITTLYGLHQHSQYDDRVVTEYEVSSARKSLNKLHHNHLDNLHRFGLTVIPKMLDEKDQISQWKQRMITAMKVDQKYTNDNRGRLHCNQESRKALHHDDFLRLGNDTGKHKLQTIVTAYFERKGITNYKLTQLQFLDAPGGCQHQVWHRDNTSPGLTVLIALEDIGSNGPTELLVCSHSISNISDITNAIYPSQEALNDNQQNAEAEAIKQDSALLACLHAGDAILYDARTIHRGRGYEAKPEEYHFTDSQKMNESVQLHRPTLVLRFDSVQTPPPGAGFIITNANQMLGSFLSFSWNTKRLFVSMLERNDKR